MLYVIAVRILLLVEIVKTFEEVVEVAVGEELPIEFDAGGKDYFWNRFCLQFSFHDDAVGCVLAHEESPQILPVRNLLVGADLNSSSVPNDDRKSAHQLADSCEFRGLHYSFVLVKQLE
jgi:hypothetical protein